jgi:hypothetical protein
VNESQGYECGVVELQRVPSASSWRYYYCVEVSMQASRWRYASLLPTMHASRPHLGYRHFMSTCPFLTGNQYGK